MGWLTNMSGRQRLWLVATLGVVLAVVAFGMVRQRAAGAALARSFSVDMSIREIATPLKATGTPLQVTGERLARELGLPPDTPRGRPLKALGISQEQLDRAVQPLLRHRETTLKYYVFVALVLLGLVYLVRLGRPDGSPASERKTWYPRWPYMVALVAGVAVCGFALGKSPEPMESVVKVFKSFMGLYPSIMNSVLVFLFFAALAVIGNKLICGWACPFGALQELIYSLPFLRKLKQRKIPFAVSNTIRIALFVVMLLLLFGIVGGQQGFSIYHFINPFNLFNLDIETASVAATILAALVVSFGFYRPFCQLICPFGLLSWVLERLSVFRVKIDRNRCTECGACIRACPLDAAKGRVAGKLLPADCFSCARCLNVCPEDAIRYGPVGKKPRASTCVNA